MAQRARASRDLSRADRAHAANDAKALASDSAHDQTRRSFGRRDLPQAGNRQEDGLHLSWLCDRAIQESTGRHMSAMKEQAIAQEAGTWLFRLKDNCTQEDRAELSKWL